MLSGTLLAFDTYAYCTLCLNENVVITKCLHWRSVMNEPIELVKPLVNTITVDR